MDTVSVNEIQRDFAGWLRRVREGEALVITENDRPIAELKPISGSTSGLRPVGLCAGQFNVPNNFNDPIPDDILRVFDSV